MFIGSHRQYPLSQTGLSLVRRSLNPERRCDCAFRQVSKVYGTIRHSMENYVYARIISTLRSSTKISSHPKPKTPHLRPKSAFAASHLYFTSSSNAFFTSENTLSASCRSSIPSGQNKPMSSVPFTIAASMSTECCQTLVYEECTADV